MQPLRSRVETVRALSPKASVSIPGFNEENEKAAQKLAELDSQLRATVSVVATVASAVNETVEKTAAAIERLNAAAAAREQLNSELAECIRSLEKTMRADVDFKYEGNKIVGAQRKC